MLSYSKHTNNPYRKLACTSCHSPHSLYQGSAQTKTAAGDNYSFSTAPYTNNVLCLGCHAGYGPFAELNQDKVAAVHTGNGGKASKNGTAITTPSSEIVQEAKDAFAEVVTKHMTEKCGMSNAIYNPTDDNLPVGRCTSCHMPKLAKSGAYSTGPDFYGNQALVEGDQGSHVFDIVWPYESTATTQGGPVDPKYSTIYTRPDGVARSYKGVGYMPNSCSKCHAGARQASIPVTAY
ncbi:MAG: hypothetical protein HY303_14355 [Candidatus Wallbacteria bacterium]|nr:hypothetical protein [Candidatus Wallbacteria bacterium]